MCKAVCDVCFRHCSIPEGKTGFCGDSLTWTLKINALTITGTGSLTVNEGLTRGVGIEFQGEYSQSCLMIDSGVTLELYSCWLAFQITNELSGTAVYYDSSSVNYTGNEIVEVSEATMGGTSYQPRSEFTEGEDYETEEEFTRLLENTEHVSFGP